MNRIAMPSNIRPYFDREIQQYREDMKTSDFRKAFRHLERAHVIGQAWFREHTSSHWQMLLFGIRIKSTGEVLGQIPRLLVGGVKSFVGKIPVGNTGGANVPPLQPMEIPEDIRKILQMDALS
jgi:hypothetical protein